MQPLADRLRPSSLATFVGQPHLVGKGKPISSMIEDGSLFSLIFWGPPGVGKTTLARIMAESTGRHFFELSAVAAGKADLKEVQTYATQQQRSLLDDYRSPVLFLDEIHRFNKAQQDYLLPMVETGQVILIGATTENPSFEVNAALLSRCRVFTLKQLSEKELDSITQTAVSELKASLSKPAKEWLHQYSNGDGRRLLTIIETAYNLYQNLSLQSIKEAAQSQHLSYDKKGEAHYDTISAFIKSMRAGDSEAALYYLARMTSAGEDPKFIARRMVLFASEDVGLAQPTALVVANAVFRAVEIIGYPEAEINLAHGVAYLANSKKDRSAYDAYRSAQQDVEKFGNLPIPMELRNAPTKLMKELGYGKDYEMYSQKSLLPDKLKKRSKQ